MSDAFLHAPTHFELVYVGPNGTNTWGFGYQPSTDTIAEMRRSNDRFCIQLVGKVYEVYDLTTVKKMTYHRRDFTIGLPVFTHEDPDAAIMWALMNL